MQLNICAIIGQGKNINIYNMFLIHVRGGKYVHKYKQYFLNINKY